MDTASIFARYLADTVTHRGTRLGPDDLEGLTAALVRMYFDHSDVFDVGYDEPLFYDCITRREAEHIIAEMAPHLRSDLVGPPA